MDVHEEPVVRVVPNVSLGEEALEALITLIEKRADVGESLCLQIRTDGALARPSVLLQYNCELQPASSFVSRRPEPSSPYP